MTTIYPVEQVCAVCGATSTHNTIGSTNTMGPSDLDMRPAPMERWTLEEQIQCCPHCGYCAADISEATEAARGVVANDAYRDELRREGYPELTCRYLCASLILSVDGRDGQAGRAALMGAWAADDAADTREAATGQNARAAASHCRRLAIGYFEADRRSGLTFAADENTADTVLADLHRRVGDFDAARGCVQACMARGADGFLQEVLGFQLRLIDARDTTCHNAGEVGADDEITFDIDDEEH